MKGIKMPRIERIFAFIAEENPQDEGVVAMKIGPNWMPLVGADMARIESLRPIAQDIAKATGKTIKLIVFETRKELEYLPKE
ncbi:hypothetical protein ES703_74742 [subsurface metagenome]